MSAVLAAMVPIFAMIVVGFLMRRYGPYGDGFWVPAERLNYFLLFPALLVANLARIELEEIQVWPMAVAMLGAVLVVAAAAYGLRHVLRIGGPAFTAVFQGAIRINAYVAIAGASGLYDSAGLTLVSIGIAVVIPAVNVLSVLVLAAHGVGAGLRGRILAGQIARNPIILACLFGILLNVAGLTLPSVLAQFLDILGRAALPLGLMSVGAGLDLLAARDSIRDLAAASALKLVLLPLATGALCAMLGVHGATASVAVLFNGCPASASSYILTRQLGGDHRLMAGIITVETVVAMVTLPLLMLLVF
ncbi:MAG: AEC family transporter [Alphaproteobacteria bacterium]|nr:AEC family transporter [Alphaproteobacteria bacterium]